MLAQPMCYCLNCGRFRKILGRGLCRPCWSDPAIRCRFEILRDNRPSGEPDPTATLRPTAVIPDFCVHGERDGECPECERNQRKKIFIFKDGA